MFPTSGYFMAVLTLFGVPWQKWLRFSLPIFLGWPLISLGLRRSPSSADGAERPAASVLLIDVRFLAAGLRPDHGQIEADDHQ